MGASDWITQHGFDLLQTLSVLGGLLFTAYAIHRDERARRISNLIAVTDQHRQLWREIYERPQLARILKSEVDLAHKSISDEETVFVNLLILHLSTVYHAMNDGLFVKLDGLKTDVREFFSLPIPNTIWNRSKALQNQDFVHFVEQCIQAA